MGVYHNVAALALLQLLSALCMPNAVEPLQQHTHKQRHVRCKLLGTCFTQWYLLQSIPWAETMATSF